MPIGSQWMSLTNVNIDWFGKSDIQKGLIDTVIVKDQSRFGRSYIQVGMYVEQFKDMGVRFIAVDDCYDSSQTDYDMMFPMRNVINEYYARERVRKQNLQRKQRRRRVNSSAPNHLSVTSSTRMTGII